MTSSPSFSAPISRPARDALLELCQRRLRPEGLLYLSYNARPGWNVRGMVREFLLAQTAGIADLRARVDAARDVCRRLVDAMGGEEHAYRRLMIDELRLVASGDPSYVAHEHLTPDNHAYWRSELAALVAEARLLKLGRALCVGDVLLYSEGDERPVAHAQLTYSIPPRRIMVEPSPIG